MPLIHENTTFHGAERRRNIELVFDPSVKTLREFQQQQKRGLREILTNACEHSLTGCKKVNGQHFHQNIYVFLSLSLNRYNALVDIRIDL